MFSARLKACLRILGGGSYYVFTKNKGQNRYSSVFDLTRDDLVQVIEDCDEIKPGVLYDAVQMYNHVRIAERILIDAQNEETEEE